jgi:two-component system sensor histidine kinase VicK
MDHLKKLHRRIRVYLLAVIVVQNIVIVGVFWALQRYTSWDISIALASSLALGVLSACVITVLFSNFVVQPIRALWQTILHLSPTEHGMAAPTFENLRLGRELVTSLAAQVYQLVNTADQAKADSRLKTDDLHNNFIAQNLPLPLVVMDATETIRFANEAAARYVGMTAADMVGKNVYMVLDMSFPGEATFDSWLKSVKAKNATAVSSWDRVRLNVLDNHPAHLFDLAAYYNRDNPDHNETMLVLFDHTKQYAQDDQAVSFMALSVHEMRTPLTLLRGYIEVFEDELGESISDPELRNFMLKMHTTAEQLTAFVNNILNVARVDDDQLELKLQSEDWSTTLKSSIEMISLRAKVRDITLKCSIARDLPPVGVDRLSIREVVNNLVDNAIKYSNTSKIVKIESYLNKEGLVETTIQDFGLGIPTSILPNLFTKFYRNHRDRAQIGGTGLGLYLSKAIVAAHGGNLWVRSREGEGSTFGFTLVPYAQLAETIKQGGDQGITRGAHGWIKNHSLYRR